MAITAMDNISPALVTLPTKCNLCPRACGVNRAAGERGYCGVGSEILVARAALHYWEEPPISATSGSGTIFFSGCPLKCVYCQNSPIASCRAGIAVSSQDIARMCLDLQSKGALNINMVTATHVAPLVRGALLDAREQGLHLPVVWNTSGYENVQAIKDNKGFIDVYLSDFKYASTRLAQNYSSAPDYSEIALRAIDAMLQAVGALSYDDYQGQTRLVSGVVVRHLMLPGELDDSKRVVKMLWQNFGTSIALSLMNQYTPVLATNAEEGATLSAQYLSQYPQLACTVRDEDYERLLDYADSLGVPDYFWQQGGAAQESFIPAFDLTGVAKAKD